MHYAHKYLVKLYLDWRNNYLTREVFAEHNQIPVSMAAQLIEMGRELFEQDIKDGIDHTE